MVKNYKYYCREAVKRNPKLYGSSFNEDGSRKKEPLMSMHYKRKKLKDAAAASLRGREKDGWVSIPVKKPELQIVGTEIKLNGRTQNLIIKKLPNKSDKRKYNRIWMHNDRVRKKLKMLKEQYGVTKPL